MALVIELELNTHASLCQTVVVLLGLNLVIALCLLAFNRGPSRLEPFGILISNNHLTVIEFGRKHTIDKQHYGGCLMIRDIHFSDYALSSVQRGQRFKELGCDSKSR